MSALCRAAKVEIEAAAFAIVGAQSRVSWIRRGYLRQAKLHLERVAALLVEIERDSW